ncbi:putative signaling protein [Caenibius tardaugens NBRC 16725]|uniref:Putative signaling protein n=1 Tax=Caenibius tardaugens NBRC 16725 TaxID=1219035 RepID=U2YJB2_9SPHN|nr:EAL domain-containing protein [Caenibius tardaugens NBRC 16725]GAD48267.1 putative signaling protein [Caenibius tardaugens NBRC 16725]
MDWAGFRREGDRGERGAPGTAHDGAVTTNFAVIGDGRLISAHWWVVALAMALAVLLPRIASQAVLTPHIAILFLAAAVLALSSGLLELSAKLSRAIASYKLVVAIALVMAPMALFGCVMTLWAVSGAVSWSVSLGGVAAVCALATLLQAFRPHMIMMVPVPLWGAVALTEGSTASVLAWAVVLPIAYCASRGQEAFLTERGIYVAAEARREQQALQILADLEQMRQGWFWETDHNGVITYLSHSVADTLRREHGDLIGNPFLSLFDNAVLGTLEAQNLAFYFTARTPFENVTVHARDSNGEMGHQWSLSGRPAYDLLGKFTGFRGSAFDLTSEHKIQEEVSRLARYDWLTGLANRHTMLKTLDKLMTMPNGESRACAIFLIDLDRFKQVNDTMGHPAGDVLLQQVAVRLQKVMATGGKVGRLGGDEFQVILGIADREKLADLASTIMANLSQPYAIDGRRVEIGASVGIAIAPEHGDTSDKLIRNADLALYAAKHDGRGRYRFFAEDLQSLAEERRKLAEDLRLAMHDGGLELHYQPIIETATEKICGFEALLRWNHPEKGLLSPAVFVEVAEDTGLISAIGEWVLRTACEDLALWPEHILVAVNLSTLQFENPQLPMIVTRTLAHAGVRASRLELEITESVFLSDDERMDAMFAALKRIGVRLSLDDFGTGHFSLAHLKKAPFNRIKIDQSFLKEAMQRGSRNGAIISAITNLAESLGMETTAEGVETREELEQVRLHGCSHVQGFVYDGVLTLAEATLRLGTVVKAVDQDQYARRPARHSTFRKVTLHRDGHVFNGTIRNISATGALVQGLWNVPAGAQFEVRLSDDLVVSATCRWAEDGLVGLAFTVPLARDRDGNLVRSDLAIQQPPKRGNIRAAV